MRTTINEKINEIEEIMLKHIKSFWNYNANIAREYNRLSAKEILKKDVLDF